uniref:Uncharacterized protein n=1 Tax=Terrapene triunguis TaxID=2587831 RepID=A0A674IMW9_9SAUR
MCLGPYLCEHFCVHSSNFWDMKAVPSTSAGEGMLDWTSRKETTPRIMGGGGGEKVRHSYSRIFPPPNPSRTHVKLVPEWGRGVRAWKERRFLCLSLLPWLGYGRAD